MKPKKYCIRFYAGREAWSRTANTFEELNEIVKRIQRSYGACSISTYQRLPLGAPADNQKEAFETVIGGGYNIRIRQLEFYFWKVILVDIEHPNSGWSPWFMIYALPGFQKGWKFVSTCSADEKWIRKQLRDIDTRCTNLNSWVRKRKKSYD